MTVTKTKQAHIWQRDEHDWYVEPYECSMALFDAEDFFGTIWDPAAGTGRITESATASGYRTISSDKVLRSGSCALRQDFLSNEPPPEFDCIVSNPPFKYAEEFVLKSLRVTAVGGKVAMLLPLVWMAGFSTKRDWLPKSPLKVVYPMSPRPSMPPGAVIEAGIKPGNGTKDFAWFVWQIGYNGNSEVKFLNTKSFKEPKTLQLV